MRPMHALTLGVLTAVAGGALIASGDDLALFAGLVLVAIGGFLELVAAVAFGIVIGQRELRQPETSASTTNLLHHLHRAEDPETRKLGPIAEGLGIAKSDARRLVETALNAGLIEPEGFSGCFRVTPAGQQLLTDPSD